MIPDSFEFSMTPGRGVTNDTPRTSRARNNEEIDLMQQSNPSRQRNYGLRRIVGAILITGSLQSGTVMADEFTEMTRMVGLMQNFFGLMESVYDNASNPERAALLQMNTMEDIYKERGQHAEMIPVYRKMLSETKQPTIRRIIYMRLADTLKETGRPDEAIKLLEEALRETVEHAEAAG